MKDKKNQEDKDSYMMINIFKFLKPPLYWNPQRIVKKLSSIQFFQKSDYRTKNTFKAFYDDTFTFKVDSAKGPKFIRGLLVVTQKYRLHDVFKKNST